MKCKYCGKKIDNDSVFCEFCGKEVSKKKHYWWIILLILIGVGSVVGGVIGLLYTMPEDSQSSNYYEEQYRDTESITDDFVDETLEDNDKMSVTTTESKTAPVGFVDLGLPSGTLWKENNEPGFYEFDIAKKKFGRFLPTKKQWEELDVNCQWIWNGSGFTVVGPNGNNIILPADGDFPCDGDGNRYGIDNVGLFGTYYSLYEDSNGFDVWTFSINNIYNTQLHDGGFGNCGRYGLHSIRLVNN